VLVRMRWKGAASVRSVERMMRFGVVIVWEVWAGSRGVEMNWFGSSV